MSLPFQLCAGIYKSAAQVAAPFIRYYLKKRIAHNKETELSIIQRQGICDLLRKQPLLWIHGASVGEILSITPLLPWLSQNWFVLLTTQTQGSKTAITPHLNDRVIHQFAPWDVPSWINKFLDHWQPQKAIFLESEIWPNILFALKKKGISTMLFNARLNHTSIKQWQKFPKLASGIFQHFSSVATPDPLVHDFLKPFVDLKTMPQLKYLSLGKPLNNSKYDFPVILAASTHSGEEEIIAKLSKKDRLIIIIPRHPERSQSLMNELRQYAPISLHSACQEMPRDGIHLVDGFGHLPYFYSRSNFAFIGGSFTSKGGHNPLEAMLESCVPICGPDMSNWQSISQDASSLIAKVQTPLELEEIIDKYLQKTPFDVAKQAQEFVLKKKEASRQIIQNILLDFIS